MKIRFLGGTRTVTGISFHLNTNNIQMLIDCGMYQGANAQDINKSQFQFEPNKINYLFLTHAHIDHSGLIPKLVKNGFR